MVTYKIDFNRELSYKRKELFRKIRQIFLPVTVIIIELSIITAVPYFVYLKNHNLIKIEKEKREAEVKRLNAELIQIKEKNRNVLVMVNFVKWFNNSNISWAEKFADLSALLPDNVWFTSLSIKKTNSGGEELIIRGRIKGGPANSLSKLSTLLTRLNGRPSFNKDISLINFVYSKVVNKKGSDEKTVEFELSGKIKKAGSQEIERE